MISLTFLRARTFNLKSTLNQGIRAGISSFSCIAEQVKLDVVSENHAEVNAMRRREIARTFTCELLLLPLWYFPNYWSLCLSRYSHRLALWFTESHPKCRSLTYIYIKKLRAKRCMHTLSTPLWVTMDISSRLPRKVALFIPIGTFWTFLLELWNRMWLNYWGRKLVYFSLPGLLPTKLHWGHIWNSLRIRFSAIKGPTLICKLLSNFGCSLSFEFLFFGQIWSWRPCTQHWCVSDPRRTFKR